MIEWERASFWSVAKIRGLSSFSFSGWDGVVEVTCLGCRREKLTG